MSKRIERDCKASSDWFMWFIRIGVTDWKGLKIIQIHSVWCWIQSDLFGLTPDSFRLKSEKTSGLKKNSKGLKNTYGWGSDSFGLKIRFGSEWISIRNFRHGVHLQSIKLCRCTLQTYKYLLNPHIKIKIKKSSLYWLYQFHATWFQLDTVITKL